MVSKLSRHLPAWVRVLAFGGMLVCAAQPGLAQAPIKAVGLFSLLGDSIEVAVSTDAPTDTRIERTERLALTAKGIGFDNIALGRMSEALKTRQPQARLELYRPTAPISSEEQRSIALGAEKAELPAWIVQAIDAKKLSHIILITRSRGDVNIRTADGNSIGRGTALGIGYYVDSLYTVRSMATGELSTGLLAPYVHVKLMLMDANSGDVVSRYDIREGRLIGDGRGHANSDPWTHLSAEQKVSLLRKEFETSLNRGARELLKAQ